MRVGLSTVPPSRADGHRRYTGSHRIIRNSGRRSLAPVIIINGLNDLQPIRIRGTAAAETGIEFDICSTRESALQRASGLC